MQKKVGFINCFFSRKMNEEQERILQVVCDRKKQSCGQVRLMEGHPVKPPSRYRAPEQL